MLRPSVTREWVGKGELSRERTKIGDGGGLTMCWQRPHMERLRAMDSRSECHGTAAMGLPCGSTDCEERNTDERQRIVGPWASYAIVLRRRDFRGVIDPLLSWRESVGCKRGREGGECRGKLQVPRQDGMVEAKELHKTGVDGLLIKIAKKVGAGVCGVLEPVQARGGAPSAAQVPPRFPRRVRRHMALPRPRVDPEDVLLFPPQEPEPHGGGEKAEVKGHGDATATAPAEPIRAQDLRAALLGRGEDERAARDRGAPSQSSRAETEAVIELESRDSHVCRLEYSTGASRVLVMADDASRTAVIRRS
ncbi:hypothetical protein BHM03_00027332 [Ensete ventricosum]|uniref:Uncharacterized protein n=1 Tax=Ensete ventricosum TaxID=4639 RepID=A0A445MHJ1_ENSVE|nr:hypothetical protein BHM03_00027332 [Ensete ventricosum]